MLFQYTLKLKKHNLNLLLIFASDKAVYLANILIFLGNYLDRFVKKVYHRISPKDQLSHIGESR